MPSIDLSYDKIQLLSGHLSIQIHKIVCIHELQSTGFYSLTNIYDDPSRPLNNASWRNSFTISESFAADFKAAFNFTAGFYLHWKSFKMQQNR